MSPQARRRAVAAAGLAAFAGLTAALFFAAGKPMDELFEEPERFRQWADAMGFGGKLAFVGMVALQVVVAVLPGEPLEIAAGFAFGAWEGALLCMVGSFAGGMAAFGLSRGLGVRAVEAFVPREKIESLGFVRDARRLTLWMWILFLIPGTPKDALTYLAGLTRMRLRTWALIAAVARVPSIVTSTVGGGALGEGEPAVAAAALGAAALAAAAGLIVWKKACAKRSRSQDSARGRFDKPEPSGYNRGAAGGPPEEGEAWTKS